MRGVGRLRRVDRGFVRRLIARIGFAATAGASFAASRLRRAQRVRNASGSLTLFVPARVGLRRASASGSARSRLRLIECPLDMMFGDERVDRRADRLRHRHRRRPDRCRPRSSPRLRPDRPSPRTPRRADRRRSAAARPTAGHRPSEIVAVIRGLGAIQFDLGAAGVEASQSSFASASIVQGDASGAPASDGDRPPGEVDPSRLPPCGARPRTRPECVPVRAAHDAASRCRIGRPVDEILRLHAHRSVRPSSPAADRSVRPRPCPAQRPGRRSVSR